MHQLGNLLSYFELRLKSIVEPLGSEKYNSLMNYRGEILLTCTSRSVACMYAELTWNFLQPVWFFLYSAKESDFPRWISIGNQTHSFKSNFYAPLGISPYNYLHRWVAFCNVFHWWTSSSSIQGKIPTGLDTGKSASIWQKYSFENNKCYLIRDTFSVALNLDLFSKYMSEQCNNVGLTSTLIL